MPRIRYTTIGDSELRHLIPELQVSQGHERSKCIQTWLYQAKYILLPIPTSGTAMLLILLACNDGFIYVDEVVVTKRRQIHILYNRLR